MAHRVAIIGAGLMGHGIAQVFAAAGAEVAIHDPVPEALDSARDRVAANLTALGKEPRAAETIVLAGSLEEAVADAEFVFEAAPEKLELKQSIFERLDSAAPSDAVLATNTSVLRIAEVGERVTRRGRVVGTHWWNPPYLVPLVEVVEAEGTDPGVLGRTIALLREIGKTPVHVKTDVAGFVGNRLQHALWREAFNLIDAGVCDPETVDTVVKAGFGSRLPVLGPIENADLVGLDLTLDIHSYILPRLEPPSPPAEGLHARVARGNLGMKSGTGYRRWTTEAANDVRERLRNHLVRSNEAAAARPKSS
jgi:3-hydroxybutyryl-CoA dehydrogenase